MNPNEKKQNSEAKEWPRPNRPLTLSDVLAPKGIEKEAPKESTDRQLQQKQQVTQDKKIKEQKQSSSQQQPPKKHVQLEQTTGTAKQGKPSAPISWHVPLSKAITDMKHIQAQQEKQHEVTIVRPRASSSSELQHKTMTMTSESLKPKIANRHQEMNYKHTEAHHIMHEMAQRQLEAARQLAMPREYQDLSHRQHEISHQHLQLSPGYYQMQQKYFERLAASQEGYHGHHSHTDMHRMPHEISSKHGEIQRMQHEMTNRSLDGSYRFAGKTYEPAEMLGDHHYIPQREPTSSSKHHEIPGEQSDRHRSHPEILQRYPKVPENHPELPSKHEENRELVPADEHGYGERQGQSSIPPALMDHDFGFSSRPVSYKEPPDASVPVKAEPDGMEVDENKDGRPDAEVKEKEEGDGNGETERVYCICRTSDSDRFMM